MKMSPYRCAKSYEERRSLSPTIAAGRGQTEARVAAIERLRRFRDDYAEAKARWCAGDRDVVFPAGTYWMVVHHGATSGRSDLQSSPRRSSSARGRRSRGEIRPPMTADLVGADAIRW
jgi:hypothetical protein